MTNKINEYIESNKHKKPPFVAVDEQEWADALEGYQNTIYESMEEDMPVEQVWTLIYFCAVAFCRGMERAEVKAGLRKETNYPRY